MHPAMHVFVSRELQQHLNSCVTVVRSLVQHMEALCEDFGDLGRALSIFARFEEGMAARQGQYTTAGSTAVQRGADLQQLGYGALRQHSLSKQVRHKVAQGSCDPSVIVMRPSAPRHVSPALQHPSLSVSSHPSNRKHTLAVQTTVHHRCVLARSRTACDAAWAAACAAACATGSLW